MFALEALKAKHGDCLLLHYEDGGKPATILIDGGPLGVWNRFLKKRLDALREERGAGDDPLPLPLVMVSHVDEDHIAGIIDLLNDVKNAGTTQPRRCRIAGIWHNHFEDVVGQPFPEDASSRNAITASVVPRFSGRGDERAQQILSSVGQGRTLRDLARGLGIPLNPHTNGKLVDSGTEATFGSVRLRVVGPSSARLRELHRKWQEDLKKNPPKQVQTAAYDDESPYNLSSIVALAECGGKRMLLTGDARGDDILEGLEGAGLLDADGRIHVDLLKMPHHGSRNNVTVDFFRRVTADHYLASGDQVKFPNPHLDTFRMLDEARPGAAYTVWLTYDLPDLATALPHVTFRQPGGASWVQVALS